MAEIRNGTLVELVRISGELRTKRGTGNKRRSTVSGIRYHVRPAKMSWRVQQRIRRVALQQPFLRLYRRHKGHRELIQKYLHDARFHVITWNDGWTVHNIHPEQGGVR